MEQSESAYRIRGATASYLRGKGVVLEEDIRSRVNKFGSIFSFSDPPLWYSFGIRIKIENSTQKLLSFFLKEDGFYTAMNDVMGFLKKKEGKEEGVYAIASSFGCLFELVLHLTSAEVNIPVTGLGVGPVTPGDIRKATQRRKHTVLAFQVEVTPKASQLAQTLGVKIICGDTVEHLCQQFQEFNNELGEDKKESESDVAAVSPCLLSILPKCVLNKEDPIVVGVYVVEGFVKVCFALLAF